MSDLLKEKVEQASKLVADSRLDVWMVLVRESSLAGDPILPFLLEGSLTWLSALIFSRSGDRVAIVGSYDADPIVASGNWTEVIPYVRDIRPHLLQTLDRFCGETPSIGLNFSMEDDKCDGLSHGLFLVLSKYLEGTRFSGALESAESICTALRGQKTESELDLMISAIKEGDDLFEEIGEFAKPGVSELEVYSRVQDRIEEKKLGYAWDRTGDPIVNSGPHSMIGHGVPSREIKVEPGHIVHVDLGVTVNGYSSDIQRCWYVGKLVLKAVEVGFAAVRAAIQAGYEMLYPGIEGWVVDDAARSSLVGAGYPEYMHALGHQVGRVAHDGGALLGPRWERYGDRVTTPIKEGEVYTLELGAMIPGHGYIGLEEMVLVTWDGCKWLSKSQDSIWLITDF